MTTAREAFLETTARLLERQGYFATGLNQIVAESGAPKGSLYHYFPEGKEELTAEVINRIGQVITARIRLNLAQPANPAEAIPQFIRTIARYVGESDFQGGGPIATVALETSASSERLRLACNAAYQSWQEAVGAKLIASGFDTARATRLATMVIALIEGATILARAAHSTAPLEQVADEVQLLLEMQNKYYL